MQVTDLSSSLHIYPMGREGKIVKHTQNKQNRKEGLEDIKFVFISLVTHSTLPT